MLFEIVATKYLSDHNIIYFSSIIMIIWYKWTLDKQKEVITIYTIHNIYKRNINRKTSMKNVNVKFYVIEDFIIE